MHQVDELRWELEPNSVERVTMGAAVNFTRSSPVVIRIEGGRVFLDRAVPNGTTPAPPPAKPAPPRGRPGPRPGRRPGRRAPAEPKGPLSIACRAHKVDAGIPCSSSSKACRARRKAYREGVRAAAPAAPAPAEISVPGKRDPVELGEETPELPEAPTKPARLLPAHPGNPRCACKECVAYRAQQSALALERAPPPMRAQA